MSLIVNKHGMNIVFFFQVEAQILYGYLGYCTYLLLQLNQVSKHDFSHFRPKAIPTSSSILKFIKIIHPNSYSLTVLKRTTLVIRNSFIVFIFQACAYDQYLTKRFLNNGFNESWLVNRVFNNSKQNRALFLLMKCTLGSDVGSFVLVLKMITSSSV